MNTVSRIIAAAFVALSLFFAPLAVAGDSDPLFVNATTDDPHRAKMALMFAANQLERKHPVTVFLNDRGVLIASKAAAEKFGEHQVLIANIIKAGGNVLICPMCKQHFGISDADLPPGIQVGNPELTGSLLFKDNTKTLTW